MQLCSFSERVFTSRLPEIGALFLLAPTTYPRIPNIYFYFDSVEQTSGKCSAPRLAHIPRQSARIFFEKFVNIGNTDYAISLGRNFDDNYYSRKHWRRVCENPFQSPAYRNYSSGYSDDLGSSMSFDEFNELVLKAICHRRAKSGNVELTLIPVKAFRIDFRDICRAPTLTSFVYTEIGLTIVVECGFCYYRVAL